MHMATDWVKVTRDTTQNNADHDRDTVQSEGCQGRPADQLQLPAIHGRGTGERDPHRGTAVGSAHGSGSCRRRSWCWWYR